MKNIKLIIYNQLIFICGIIVFVFLMSYIIKPGIMLDFLTINTFLIYLIYNSNKILFKKYCNFSKITAVSYVRLFLTSLISLFIGTILFIIVLFIVFFKLQGANIFIILKKEYSNFIGLFIVITLIFMVLELFKGWKNEAVNAERKKFEELKYHYEILKNQVNPHFLFNSLNILNSIISKDAEQAKRFVQNFSKIYRYVLDKQDYDFVPLSDELNFIDSYFYLIKSRHLEKIITNIDITNSTNYLIIPMSLQLLVENAIKHNAATNENSLKIMIFIENDYIVIRNNINIKNIYEPTSKISLVNLSKRYLFLTGKDIEIINKNEEFVVRLPIIKPKINK